MDAFERVLNEPGSLRARRALQAAWATIGDPRAELIEKQLAYRDIPRAERSSAMARELDRAITRLVAEHGRAWAGRVAELVDDFEFRRGLIALVTLPGETFAGVAPELFTLAPIQHVNLVAPLGPIAAILTSPWVARLSSLHIENIGAAFGDAEARALADAPHASSLRAISLWNNSIGEDGVHAIAASPHLARAEYIGFTGNPADPTPYVLEDEGDYTAGRPALAAQLEQTYGRRPWLDVPSGDLAGWPADRDDLAIASENATPGHRPRARSADELALYIEERPCAQCGTPTSEALLTRDVDIHADVIHYTYTGACTSCGTPLRYEVDGPYGWPELPLFSYGGDTPSALFAPDELLAIAERWAREAAPDPRTLLLDDYFKYIRLLGSAAALIDEAGKFNAPGVDRAELDTRKADLVARRARYLEISAEMNARRRALQPPRAPRVAITPESLAMHEAWWNRGRTGAGRLIAEHSSVGGLSLGNIKLSGARLVHVSFDSATVDFARLMSTEMEECTAVGANFTHSTFDNATLDRCRFDRARMGLTSFQDGRITGGSFRRATADRALWNRIHITGADLRELQFGDCVLDGALIEDCDLRDANFARVTPSLDLCSAYNATFRRCDLRGARFDGRRFDGARFIDCKTDGLPEMVDNHPRRG